MKIRAWILGLCALSGWAAFALADELALPVDIDRAEVAIDAAQLAGHVRFLADDLLEGRAPASRGDRLARRYIATTLEGLGLQPGNGRGGWEQPFEIVGKTSRAPETWHFKGADETTTLGLRTREQFVAWTDRQQKQVELKDAELVFVGYAMTAPEYDWDDFKGVDLRGKVVVMLNNDPDWSPELFAGVRRLYYGRWDYKYASAARHGAAGAILIHTRESAGYPWQVVQSSWTGESFELPAGAEPRLDVAAWVTDDAASSLVALAGHDLDALRSAARKRDFRPIPLGLTTSISVSCALRRERTANVAGLLPGSDAKLAREVVVYTAHHDHIGVGEPDSTGDGIHNGALDNAAGVAQMLAIARGFSRLEQPPRRSVLFLAVAAEEQGLLGSQHYAQNPTFPPGRIAANINIDGGNIWGRTLDLPLIGHGKSDLDAIAAAVAERQGRRLTPEQFPDRGFFYRSDQFNFAKIGVPALYFDSGTEFVDRPAGWGAEQIEIWEDRNYHQPSDEIEAGWDWSGMVEDARLAFVAGLAVAQREALPAWVPGDEFEDDRARELGRLSD